ncbi:hypothetical protein KAR91_62750 [Candidatus Pacearchaeota archaeon]|nr:hypothetical protein [Candidatus Pacearchaeota archaeon]
MSSYTSKDVRVLKEIEHVQLNPSMYIGCTEMPTHLIEEGLDNALDEIQAGFASIVAINIDTKKHEFSIIDNGRGIPIDDNVPVTISSKLFSGAKFQDSKTAYEIASGMHGVGLITINALSTYYSVEIYRDGKKALFQWEKAKLKKKSIISSNGVKPPFSTKISFTPDKKYFEKMIPDVTRIKRRLKTAAAEIAGDQIFVLNVDDQREIFRLTLQDHFSQNCLTEQDVLITPIMSCKSYFRPEAFSIMFAYSGKGAVSPRIMSSVNLLPVDDGGTHVNLLYDVLRDYFAIKAKKFGYSFQPQDCLVGLRAYLSLKLKEPKFSSQTKDRLTNRKTYFDKLITQIKIQIDEYFTTEPEVLDTLLQTFQNYRKKLDSSKIKTAGTGRRGATKFTKLRDCTMPGGELFIVEGDSAGGGFVSCRDPRIHAILPLRGKIPNAGNAKDIIKNKEVKEMIMSLGTGYGPNFDISRLKYDKIICATDADDDGAHIFCLVTLILALLVPEVVQNGHYYLLETPLYAINEKKIFQPLWTDEEIKSAQDANRKLTRLKGLGELNPDQLGMVALNPQERKLVPVSYSADIEKMVKLFTGADEKRKLLEGSWSL